MIKPQNEFKSTQLPNHTVELNKADSIILTLRDKVEFLQNCMSISDVQHLQTYEEIFRILDYVGTLSQSIFDIQDELENEFMKKYKNSHLWTDHYEIIHKPYNVLKNRCYKMLDELDELYIECNGKHPSNWKP